MLRNLCLAVLIVLGPAGMADDDPELLFRRFLNIRRASGPALSPDGSKLGFLTDITGVNQVWRVDAPEGWPDQLTFGDDRVQGVSWSPKGDSLIFTRDAGGNERAQIFLMTPKGTEVKDLTALPEAKHLFGGFSPDGDRICFASNRRNTAYFDVYVMELPEGEAKVVYENDGFNVPVSWSPDGKRLIVATWRSNFDSDISVLDIESGEVTKLNPDGQVARYEDSDWTPDGKGIYVVTDLGRDFLGIATIAIGDRSLKYVDTPDWDIEGFRLSPDRTRIASVQNEDGYSRLRLRNLEDWSDIELPEIPRGLIGGLDFSENGRCLAFTYQGSASPTDVWRLDIEGKKLDRMTRSSLAGLDPEKFLEPELIHYPTFDDRQIPAFLYLPRGAARDGTLPVIVSAHGGPEGQERPWFSSFKQFFLQRGYGILAPNVRGSTGYGKEYSHLDDVRNRSKSVEDLARGVDYLIENKIAHPKRIAVMGGSYGGFMTLASLTTFPEKFSAGIDIVGIANFKTFLERTGAWRRKIREAEYGSLADDAEFLEEISPLNQVDRIMAPLLVIHGKNDPRVPYTEAEQIVEALRSRNRPVDYLLFEDEGHGIAKLKNRVAAYARIVSFLDERMKAPSE